MVWLDGGIKGRAASLARSGFIFQLALCAKLSGWRVFCPSDDRAQRRSVSGLDRHYSVGHLPKGKRRTSISASDNALKRGRCRSTGAPPHCGASAARSKSDCDQQNPRGAAPSRTIKAAHRLLNPKALPPHLCTILRSSCMADGSVPGSHPIGNATWLVSARERTRTGAAATCRMPDLVGDLRPIHLQCPGREAQRRGWPACQGSLATGQLPWRPILPS